ncbi:MAG: hypothetical protein ACTSQ9_03705 [Candidatus Hodarchaeales archaeon]
MSKELFGKIGFVVLLFAAFLYIFSLINIPLATLTTTDVTTANQLSLVNLWDNMNGVTLIQGFVIFTALLGASSQFTPPTKIKKPYEEDP